MVEYSVEKDATFCFVCYIEQNALVEIHLFKDSQDKDIINLFQQGDHRVIL